MVIKGHPNCLFCEFENITALGLLGSDNIAKIGTV